MGIEAGVNVMPGPFELLVIVLMACIPVGLLVGVFYIVRAAVQSAIKAEGCGRQVRETAGD
jgi:hypothetical protein